MIYLQVWFYCHVLFSGVKWRQHLQTLSLMRLYSIFCREPTEEEKHLQSVLGADMLVPTMVSRMCILLKFVLGHVHRNSLGFLKLSSVRCYRGEQRKHENWTSRKPNHNRKQSSNTLLAVWSNKKIQGISLSNPIWPAKPSSLSGLGVDSQTRIFPPRSSHSPTWT